MPKRYSTALFTPPTLTVSQIPYRRQRRCTSEVLLLTARAARQAAGQGDRQAAAHRGDRRWVMAFRPHRDALGAASLRVAQALGVGSALEGGKDFARERGSHRPQGTRWRDDESRANRVLHNDRARVPA